MGNGPPEQRSRMSKSGAGLVTRQRMQGAFAVAIVADLVQMIVFPWFVEGAASPADDVVDVCVGGVLTYLLGWHWEFAPSFLGKLVPGVDLVPLWTLAVVNVYRTSKRGPVTIEGKIG